MLRWLYRIADGLRHRARLRDPACEPAHALGARGEDLAHRYLERQCGMIVVARNYVTASGDAEADLIAWDGDTLAVVEVKTRQSGAYGPPERNISREQESRVIRAGKYYASRAGVDWSQLRFDVVTVLLDSDWGKPEIQYFKAALGRKRRVRFAGVGERVSGLGAR